MLNFLAYLNIPLSHHSSCLPRGPRRRNLLQPNSPWSSTASSLLQLQHNEVVMEKPVSSQAWSSSWSVISTHKRCNLWFLFPCTTAYHNEVYRRSGGREVGNRSFEVTKTDRIRRRKCLSTTIYKETQVSMKRLGNLRNLLTRKSKGYSIHQVARTLFDLLKNPSLFIQNI